MGAIEFPPIVVDTASDDREGRLLMDGDQLVGVAVYLAAEEQGELRGSWSLEAGFGPLDVARPTSFRDLSSLEAWTLNLCARKP